MKLALIAAHLLFVAVAFGQEPEAEKKSADPGFEIKSMKCFGEKTAKKASTAGDGAKGKSGTRVAASEGPGAELANLTFPEDQLKQYFEFQFGPGSGGKTVDVSLRSIRTTLGANLKILEVSGKTSKDGKLPAEWNLKQNWPVGLYKVFFSCEGESLGTAGYRVKAVKDRETPIVATGVTIFSINDGESTEKTELTTEDNDLNFKCETKGAYTKGAKVRMLVRVKGEEEKDQILEGSEVKLEDWPLEDTEIIYSLELPDKFPDGDYDMVIFVNEKQLVAHPFTVTK